MIKTVLITGARGFIAKKIAALLKESGLIIIGTSRNPGPVPNFTEVLYGVLGEPLNDVFEKYMVDAVIHCAYDMHDLDNVINAQGTIVWARQAEENHAKLQIFMSSISAAEDALAPYGQKKYEVEKWFIERQQVVFRLGLVVGKEGLFGRIIETVKKSPVIPLVDMGRTPFYPSDINVVSEIVRDTLLEKNSTRRGRVWNLQQEDPVLFVDILREIRRQCNLYRIFVPIPYFAVSILLKLMDKFKFLSLGISSNNLKGFRQVRGKSFKSDLDYLGYPEYPIEILLNKTLE